MRDLVAKTLRAATVCVAMLAARESYASSLTGDTNATGLFIAGQSVSVTFTATGASGQTLTVAFQDADGNVLGTHAVTVTSDPWSGSVPAPSTKLGFYRVYGTLSDGTTISPEGSNAQADASASFTTYAIVPDPSLRKATITDDHAFFGLAGGGNVGNQIWAQLGARWIKDSQWSWSAMEPNANERNTFVANPSSMETGWMNGTAPWVVFSLPNLTVNGRPYQGTPDVCVQGTFAYNTCAVAPSYDQDWETFTAHVATNWPLVHPSRTHRYYEMTWEPIYPWGYLGTPAELVNLYSLAYAAMKAADPDAIIVGPTKFILPAVGDADDLLAAGIAQYLDVFSAHPYILNDVGYYGASLPEWGYWDPELAGLPSLLATQKRTVAEAAGHDLPNIGTEQGYPTHQQTAYELDQATRLIRQNLILLGQGWQLNIAFYFSDYPSGPDSQWMNTGTSFWDYGLFYNLAEGDYDGYAPSKIAPKPIAAAYAAMTFLLDDRKSVNDVNWLGDTTRGYVFESFDDPTDEVLALWDFSGSPVQVTITPGVGSVDVYDWMGNARTMTAASDGTLQLTLTDEPVYVKGVAASRWGSQRGNTNVALGKVVTTSSDGSGEGGAASTGSLAVDGDVWANESRWVSTNDANDKWLSVDLGAETSIDEVRFFTGQYVAGAHANVYGNAVPSYRVQSWNGSSWTDVAARTSNTKAAVDEVFPPALTSRVRLYFDASGTVGQVMLYEVEILSSTSSSGAPATDAGKHPDAAPMHDSGVPTSAPGRTEDASPRSPADAEPATPGSTGGCSQAAGRTVDDEASFIIVCGAVALVARRRRRAAGVSGLLRART